MRRQRYEEPLLRRSGRHRARCSSMSRTLSTPTLRTTARQPYPCIWGSHYKRPRRVELASRHTGTPAHRQPKRQTAKFRARQKHIQTYPHTEDRQTDTETGWPTVGYTYTGGRTGRQAAGPTRDFLGLGWIDLVAGAVILWALTLTRAECSYRGYKHIYGQKYLQYMGRQIIEILENSKKY